MNDFLSQQRQKWADDRERLESALTKLEQDVAAAQATEKELEEKRSENIRLKETINKLRNDLEEIRSGGVNMKRYP